jgi:hypothetical protein
LVLLLLGLWQDRNIVVEGFGEGRKKLLASWYPASREREKERDKGMYTQYTPSRALLQ